MSGKTIFSITTDDVEMILGRKLTNDEIDTFKRKFAIDHWSEEVESFAREHDIDDIETLKLKLREAKENFENERQRADNLVDENETLGKEINKLYTEIQNMSDENEGLSEQVSDLQRKITLYKEAVNREMNPPYVYNEKAEKALELITEAGKLRDMGKHNKANFIIHQFYKENIREDNNDNDE